MSPTYCFGWRILLVLQPQIGAFHSPRKAEVGGEERFAAVGTADIHLAVVVMDVGDTGTKTRPGCHTTRTVVSLPLFEVASAVHAVGAWTMRVAEATATRRAVDRAPLGAPEVRDLVHMLLPRSAHGTECVGRGSSSNSSSWRREY